LWARVRAPRCFVSEQAWQAALSWSLRVRELFGAFASIYASVGIPEEEEGVCDCGRVSELHAVSWGQQAWQVALYSCLRGRELFGALASRSTPETTAEEEETSDCGRVSELPAFVSWDIDIHTRRQLQLRDQESHVCMHVSPCPKHPRSTDSQHSSAPCQNQRFRWRLPWTTTCRPGLCAPCSEYVVSSRRCGAYGISVI